MTEVTNKNGIPFNIDAIATDLNNKMDRDGLNSLASVCVESYQSGNSWYRVYSDGWCEQGGEVSATNQVNTTVNLLKNYTNTNYQVQVTYNSTGTGAVGGAPSGANLKSTSSFAVGTGGGNYAWYTCGYIN